MDDEYYTDDYDWSEYYDNYDNYDNYVPDDSGDDSGDNSQYNYTGDVNGLDLPIDQTLLDADPAAADIPAATIADAINKGQAVSPSLMQKLYGAISTNGKLDLAKAATLGLGVLSAARSIQDAINPPKVGYQGSVPQLAAVREGYGATQTPFQAAGVRPGAAGQRYLTDVTYAAPSGLEAAQAENRAQATQLDAANVAHAQRLRPAAPPAAPKNYDAFFGRTPAQVTAQPQPAPMPTQPMAKGGVAGKYLGGSSDGMADKIPAQIDNKQRAKLSHGEFVIPADVVSHLGNGNSDAGAQELYKMMARVRQERTGNPNQGKRINPSKFTGGGLAAAYSGGGDVRGFAGESGSAVTAPAGTIGTEQNLSSWAGPYVTNMLGQGQALANAPYQAYQGPLTAGLSGLQQQAVGGAGAIQTPMGIGQAAGTAGTAATGMGNLGYTPPTGSLDSTTLAGYMNPYLKQSLDPQLAEARRQSQITQQGNAAKMTQAGAFGGSRQALLDAETQRNLGTNLANITGQGYNTAYNNAVSQYNTEQGRDIQAGQFGANFGLQALQGQVGAAQAQGQLGALQNQTGLANLNAQMSMGNTEREVAQAGMTADQAQFAAERDNPYRMVQYQQSLLQGLPMTSQQYITNKNPYAVAAAEGNALLNPPAPTAPTVP